MPMRLDVLLRVPNVVVDATGFPIVLVSIKGAPPRSDFRLLLDASTMLLDRRAQFVAVIDALEAELVLEHVFDASAWLEREDHRLRSLCRGVAVALPPTALAARRAFLSTCPLRTRVVVDEVANGVSWGVRVLGPPAVAEVPELS